ncbi:MAG: sensor histidine kinase [Variovorax sp.]|nr:sensor histidine kinase [Variovorax sp.]
MEAISALIAIALMAPLLGYLALHHGNFAAVDTIVYDQALKARPLAPRGDVVVVAVDDASLAVLGRWPWSRAVHASLLEKIAAGKPKAVLMDVFMTEPSSDPADDDVLARAMRKVPVYLPLLFSAGYEGKSPADPFVRPVAVLAEAAAGLGHVDVGADADGLVRRLFLWEGPIDGMQPYLVSLLPGSPGPGKASSFVSDPNNRGWQLRGPLPLSFAGVAGSHQTLSYLDVLHGKIAAGFWRDKTVFVGASAAGLGDQMPVPNAGASGAMPGVEIHANAFDTLRQGASPLLLDNAPAVLRWAWIALPCWVLLACLGRFRHSMLLLLAAAAAVVAVCASAFASSRLWLPPVAPLLSLIAAYLLWTWRESTQLWRYFEQRLQQVDGASALSLELVTPRDARRTGAPTALLRRADALDRVMVRLRTLEELLRSTVARLDVAVLVCRVDGDIVLANDAARSLLGLGIAEVGSDTALVGQKLLPVIAGHSVPLGGGWTTRSGTAQPTEALSGAVMVTPAGRVFRVDIVTVDRAPSATSSGWLAVLHELTEEHRRREQHDQWLGFLSHDLRSPQTTILSMLTLDEARNAVDSSSLALRSRIRAEAERTIRLADDLIDLTSAQSGRYRYAPVELGNLLLDAMDQVYAQAQLRGVTLAERFREGQCFVLADGSLLTRAVVNLLGNAIRHSRPGQSVMMCLEFDADRREAVCTVADDGDGMDESQRRSLFANESLGSSGAGVVPAASEVARRRGIGLLVVQAVIRQHRGWVEVDSAPGVGSTFWFGLPIADAADIVVDDEEEDEEGEEGDPARNAMSATSPAGPAQSGFSSISA